MFMSSIPSSPPRRLNSKKNRKVNRCCCPFHKPVFLFAAIVFFSVATSLISGVLFWYNLDPINHTNTRHLKSGHSLLSVTELQRKVDCGDEKINPVVGEEATSSVTTDINLPKREDECAIEFERLNQDQVHGLTKQSLERSRAWIGNKERLTNVARSLQSGKSLNVVAFGGSITKAHGVVEESKNRYSSKLEQWLNKFYPQKNSEGASHRVYNMAVHGADMCSVSKRIHKILEELAEDGVPHVDLFILEFGVNDYQGQDDLKHVDHKTEAFFDGFEKVALCAEVVVNKLIRLVPTSAVMFLEFRTGILTRKTAQILHMGVAEHYQIPVLSYTEAMFPEYLHLASLLNASESYSVSKQAQSYSTGDDEYEQSLLLPYPYGCSPCRANNIIEAFRSHGCKSVCVLMQRSGFPCDEANTPPGRQPCYVPMFAHDAVHPSLVGHSIARDLIVHAITSTWRDHVCAQPNVDVVPVQKHILPTSGWLLGSPTALESRGNFILVNDTMRMVSKWDELKPTNHTPGWSYYSDTGEVNHKPGWIATNDNGNEVIEFDIDLPHHSCYVVYLAVLRSYVGMGAFTVQVYDLNTKKMKTMFSDGLWKAHISVWSDTQVTQDDVPSCTGRCKVFVTTHPKKDDRDGNKVKILTLSVRKCASI